MEVPQGTATQVSPIVDTGSILTVLKSSCFPAARIQEDGRAVNRMSQNVRTKAVRRTIFLSSQNKIQRDKRMLCREKIPGEVISTFREFSKRGSSARNDDASHKRAGPRMDDDPVPKALMDAMDDLEDFQTVVGSTSQSSQSLATSTITKHEHGSLYFACQIRAISVICLKIYSRDN